MTTGLEKILHEFRHKKILVVGDMVLDQFLYGEIARVSREAPVLILRHTRTECTAGSGGNAAMNLRSLGAEVVPIGLVARDVSGRRLEGLFRNAGIATTGLVHSKLRQTTTKTRIMGGLAHSSAQQMVRVDEENEGPISSKLQRAIIGKIQEHLPGCHAVVISDYGYGVIGSAVMERLVRASRARAIPLVVDSRFRMHQFHHVSAITPNVTEVEEAYDCRLDNDLAAIEAKTREIVASQSLEALLVTRGKFGMSLLVRGQKMQHIPIFGSDQVADVTGAGDTVIAAFTLSLAAGAGYLDAARLSNYAGGLVVMKRGTATVSLAELHQAIRKDAASR